MIIPVEVRGLVEKAVTALDRTARAQEELLKMARESSAEMESGPLICPLCGETNPDVHTDEQSGSGSLSQIVIPMTMLCCKHIVYAIPNGWIMTPNRSEAISIVTERAENGSSNGTGNDRA